MAGPFKKKETEERLEKQRAEKQEQEERQYNLKIDGKDVADLTGKAERKEKPRRSGGLG